MLLVVVGTGRCGSTLLTELLARHPDVGFVSGLDDKLPKLNLRGRVNGPAYRRSAPRPAQARALRDATGPIDPRRLRIAPSEGWRLFERSITPGLSRPCRDLVATDLTPYLRERVCEFFADRFRAQRSRVFVQHLTGWPRTGLLRAAFPDLRVIHVVRDGRAVANSWMQMGWWDGWRGPSNWYLGPLPDPYQRAWLDTDRSFAALAGIGWAMLEDAFDNARQSTPDEQWFDIRYEDLLTEPRRQLGRMLEWAGLPWSRRFEAGLRRHRLEPARRTAYRKHLNPEHISDIERVAHRQLVRWGYVPATTPHEGDDEHRASPPYTAPLPCPAPRGDDREPAGVPGGGA